MPPPPTITRLGRAAAGRAGTAKSPLPTAAFKSPRRLIRPFAWEGEFIITLAWHKSQGCAIGNRLVQPAAQEHGWRFAPPDAARQFPRPPPVAATAAGGGGCATGGGQRSF